ncbi:unnamed protein product [Rangifer tarandus platyrhynchus]|uniref:Uncharacterized protein n=1 Tax=Rangifer tarandus platyrhynchus TaxID=3082113 RepID=A0ABN8YQD9_RANTA|nr:unnamed protein product [Rangifer tarandus platyrhynchus]
MVKNLPAKQETWVQSLSQEDRLEKGMATHSSILAWRIPCTEEPGRLQRIGLQRAGYDLATNTFTFSLFKSYLAQKEESELMEICRFGIELQIFHLAAIKS